jgi:DNA-binding transcriptional regulator YbjK
MSASTRRTVIADAIIATLAGSGSRGLTHRAVDEAAGLAAGSTSYYFRSRAALLEAAVARLTEVDAEAVTNAGDDADPASAVAALMQDALTGTGRTRTLARYELSLEAARRPELREALAAGTARLEHMLADRLLTRLPQADAEELARDQLAFIDGILFAEVTGTGSRPRSPDDLRAAAAAIIAGQRLAGSP